MSKTKPFKISKQVVWQAYCRVKANHRAAGVDGQSFEAFEKDLKGSLYKVWSRMSSCCYFPPPVRLVEIEKGGGKKRALGIPTVADEVAQLVVKIYLEPQIEPHSHRDSYWYRLGKSALDAVAPNTPRPVQSRSTERSINRSSLECQPRNLCRYGSTLGGWINRGGLM